MFRVGDSIAPIRNTPNPKAEFSMLVRPHAKLALATSLLLVAVALAACGSNPVDSERRLDAGADASTDGVSRTDSSATDVRADDADESDGFDSDRVDSDGTDPDGTDVVSDARGCDLDEQPTCTFGCGGDAFLVGECLDGAWVCPDGTTPMDECPPGSCFGLPGTGEVCDDGWKCKPWERRGLDDCPAEERMCHTCDGFEAPFETATCTCACSEDGTVRCAPTPVDCMMRSESDLAGVSIVMSEERCRFTQDELAAGVEIEYRVFVDEATNTAVRPRPADAGGCGTPGPSGLIVFEEIRGGDERFCRCDVGLCPGFDETVDLVPGTHEHAIAWDGRNWNGPSDTGMPRGEPFPPGEYTVRVTATGEHIDAAGETAEFEVVGELDITIVE